MKADDFKCQQNGEDDEADYMPNMRGSDVRRPMSADDSHMTNKDFETDQGENDLPSVNPIGTTDIFD